MPRDAHLEFIREHGFRAKRDAGGNVWGEMLWSDGTCRWEQIGRSWQSVKDWLGY